MASNPIVLFVDDEVPVLESIVLTQSRRYDVRTAESGEQGLDLLERTPQTAVVVSDMRMPAMDGASFLSRVKEKAPTAIRIVLTGHADIDNAARAVNEGRIFRFLLKPCGPERMTEVLSDAVEMHRLITAERVLLQQTLLGSIKAVVNVLGLANPKATGRAQRVRNRSRAAAEELGLEHPWGVEFAAIFSQLSAASLPEDVAEKVYSGKPLSRSEHEQLIHSMTGINDILADIPRLEPVTSTLKELIALSESSAGGIGEPVAPTRDARLLHAVIDLDRLESDGLSTRQALDELARNRKAYGPDTLAALERSIARSDELDEATCSPHELVHGMVLADDLKTTDGLLLLPRGFELTRNTFDSLLRRFLKRLPNGIKVRLPASGRAEE